MCIKNKIYYAAGEQKFTNDRCPKDSSLLVFVAAMYGVGFVLECPICGIRILTWAIYRD